MSYHRSGGNTQQSYESCASSCRVPLLLLSYYPFTSSTGTPVPLQLGQSFLSRSNPVLLHTPQLNSAITFFFGETTTSFGGNEPAGTVASLPGIFADVFFVIRPL